MQPLDSRLLRYARSSRSFLAVGGGIALADTIAVIGAAYSVTRAITGVVAGEPWSLVGASAAAIGAFALARSLLAWASEVVGTRGAAMARRELRSGVLDAVPLLGADWLARHNSARLTTLLGHGLDALDDYFARYLPQLLRTAITVPVLVCVVFWQDWLSGVILVVTLPIIPMFMVLIGLATRAVQRRQWTGLSRLSAHFLDVVNGLSTLKVFGREKRQIDRMAQITDDYRRSTMAVLRVSFLSGFVLELMASLSVALIAVSIGFRLVDGALPLVTGLFVLLLAPDVFLPIRQVGANFHAAAEGVEASQDAFEILDQADIAPRTDVSRQAYGDLVLHGVSAERGDEMLLVDLQVRFRRGSIVAVTGVSGVGKSTLLGIIAGFTPHSGTVTVGAADVTDSPASDRPWLAWSPQHPGLQAGTVLSNVTLGDPVPDSGQASRALELAAAREVDLKTPIGPANAGISGGQAQRVGLARCFYRALKNQASIIALDEPSSALDRDTERVLAHGIRELAEGGACVIVVSHRKQLIEWADETLALGAEREVAR